MWGAEWKQETTKQLDTFPIYRRCLVRYNQEKRAMIHSSRVPTLPDFNQMEWHNSQRAFFNVDVQSTLQLIPAQQWSDCNENHYLTNRHRDSHYNDNHRLHHPDHHYTIISVISFKIHMHGSSLRTAPCSCMQHLSFSFLTQVKFSLNETILMGRRLEAVILKLETSLHFLWGETMTWIMEMSTFLQIYTNSIVTYVCIFNAITREVI